MKKLFLVLLALLLTLTLLPGCEKDVTPGETDPTGETEPTGNTEPSQLAVPYETFEDIVAALADIEPNPDGYTVLSFTDGSRLVTLTHTDVDTYNSWVENGNFCTSKTYNANGVLLEWYDVDRAGGQEIFTYYVPFPETGPEETEPSVDNYLPDVKGEDLRSLEDIRHLFSLVDPSTVKTLSPTAREADLFNAYEQIYIVEDTEWGLSARIQVFETGDSYYINFNFDGSYGRSSRITNEKGETVEILQNYDKDHKLITWHETTSFTNEKGE